MIKYYEEVDCNLVTESELIDDAVLVIGSIAIGLILIVVVWLMMGR